MWISEQGRRRAEPDGTALVGRVTLPGDPAGVYLAGERRELPVFGPGGYVWRPEEGEQVLVLNHAFLILMLHLHLIAVCLTDRTVFICPLIPDVAV